jgi:hypothetical protein
MWSALLFLLLNVTTRSELAPSKGSLVGDVGDDFLGAAGLSQNKTAAGNGQGVRPAAVSLVSKRRGISTARDHYSMTNVVKGRLRMGVWH